MFIDFRERGRERERERQNIDVKEKHWLVASCTHPDQESNLGYNLGLCPNLGLNPQPFGVWNKAPTNWALGQGSNNLVFNDYAYCLKLWVLSNTSATHQRDHWLQQSMERDPRSLQSWVLAWLSKQFPFLYSPGLWFAFLLPSETL